MCTANPHSIFAAFSNLSQRISKKDVLSSLLLWRYSRPAWTRSCAACCRWPCFSRGVGLDDPQRSLPTLNLLWFCDLHIECQALSGPLFHVFIQSSSEALLYFGIKGDLQQWVPQSNCVPPGVLFPCCKSVVSFYAPLLLHGVRQWTILLKGSRLKGYQSQTCQFLPNTSTTQFPPILLTKELVMIKFLHGSGY